MELYIQIERLLRENSALDAAYAETFNSLNREFREKEERISSLIASLGLRSAYPPTVADIRCGTSVNTEVEEAELPYGVPGASYAFEIPRKVNDELLIYIDNGFFSDWGHYISFATLIHEEAKKRNIDLWHFTTDDVSEEGANRFSLIKLFRYRAILGDDNGLVGSVTTTGDFSFLDAVSKRLVDDHTNKVLLSFRVAIESILDALLSGVSPYKKVSVYMYTSHPFYVALFAEMLDSPRYKNLNIAVHLSLFYLNLDFCNGKKVPEYEALLRLTSQSLEKYDTKGKIRIYADSERTIRLYSPYIKRRIELSPIPLGSVSSSALSERKPAGKDITIGFFGFAHEKQGYHLFKALYDALIHDKKYSHVNFIVRHNIKFSPAEMLSLAIQFQKERERVVHLPGNFLLPETYENYMNACDIIAIPHSKSYYPCQTSGLFVNALMKGKIVVVPQDTWMADQIRQYGAGSAFESGNTDSFLKAVTKIIENVDAYRSNSFRNISEFCRLHTVQNLFDGLLYSEKMPPSKDFIKKEDEQDELHKSISEAVVATSIAPFNLEKQRQAILSWLSVGFDVVSLNCPEEIAQLQPHFPEVKFIRAERDARSIAGKPLVFFDDIIGYLSRTGAAVVGIINSDIRLNAERDLLPFLKCETEDAMVIGSRVDVESFDNVYGTFYPIGFDYFFYKPSMLSCYPSEGFGLGMPWWDYWAPFVPLSKKITVKQLIPPIGYHVRHAFKWSKETYNLYAEKFADWIDRERIALELDEKIIEANGKNHAFYLAVLKCIHDNTQKITYPASISHRLENMETILPTQLERLQSIESDLSRRTRLSIFENYLRANLGMRADPLSCYLTLSTLYAEKGHLKDAMDIFIEFGLNLNTTEASDSSGNAFSHSIQVSRDQNANQRNTQISSIETDLFRFKNIHREKRCFVIGNGPSLNKMDLNKLKGEHVFCTNAFFLLFPKISWRPQYYTCVDTRVLPDRANDIIKMHKENPEMVLFFPHELINHQTREVMPTDKIIPPAINRLYFTQKGQGFDDLPFSAFSIEADNYVIEPYTVTVTALQLAFLMGFEPIYLIGCDTDYKVPSTVIKEGVHKELGHLCFTSTEDDDPNHFSPDYFGKGRKWHNPQVHNMIWHYEMAHEAIALCGRHIYNATVGGRLEVFPRVDFESLF